MIILFAVDILEGINQVNGCLGGAYIVVGFIILQLLPTLSTGELIVASVGIAEAKLRFQIPMPAKRP